MACIQYDLPLQLQIHNTLDRIRPQKTHQWSQNAHYTFKGKVLALRATGAPEGSAKSNKIPCDLPAESADQNPARATSYGILSKVV